MSASSDSRHTHFLSLHSSKQEPKLVEEDSGQVSDEAFDISKSYFLARPIEEFIRLASLSFAMI